MWHVTCDIWHVTCDIWHVTFDMWHLTCDMWHLTFGMWHVTFDMWHVTCDMWHVTCHMSHVTCDITCDMWHVTFDMWHLTCDIWHVIFDMWHANLWHVTHDSDTWHVICGYVTYDVTNFWSLQLQYISILYVYRKWWCVCFCFVFSKLWNWFKNSKHSMQNVFLTNQEQTNRTFSRAWHNLVPRVSLSSRPPRAREEEKPCGKKRDPGNEIAIGIGCVFYASSSDWFIVFVMIAHGQVYGSSLENHSKRSLEWQMMFRNIFVFVLIMLFVLLLQFSPAVPSDREFTTLWQFHARHHHAQQHHNSHRRSARWWLGTKHGNNYYFIAFAVETDAFYVVPLQLNAQPRSQGLSSNLFNRVWQEEERPWERGC